MTAASCSLVLETHNLEGGGGDIAGGLVRVLGRLATQTRRLDTLADFVITHRGIDAAGRVACEAAAGVPIRWLALGDEVGYYDAKNRGFDVARGDVVVFADADCWPDPTWLESLLLPFADPRVQAVAGRTTYRRDLLGTAASTIDFMYFPSPHGAGYTRNFYANNIAFRRDVFETRRFGQHEMYRGHCAVLGLDLHKARIPIVFAPAARTIHRFPDSVRELLKLRLMRGRDTYELTPQLGRALASDLELPRLGPVVPLAVLGVRFGFSLRSINHQQMPVARGLKKLAVAGAIAAMSAVDAVGAFAGGLRLMAAKPEAALSYHGDGDRLAA
ncbi:MAG: glycosyltransferase [Deltaproteobacteria bacterium]|nr:glycosyltransferase [Deltaproteobacteria bacterium]